MKFEEFKNANGFELGAYFQSKKLHELSIEELAYIHLDRSPGVTIIESGRMTSSLRDLLETARAGARLRDTKIYGPIFACFAILDQIGGAYRKKSKKTPYQNGIKVALDLFGGYNKDEIEYLTTLRNGLYHDGSLLSRNQNGKTNVFFRLDPTATQTLTMPSKPWDGVFHDSLNDYTSKINVSMLRVDLEKIVGDCRNALLDGELVMQITDPREFFYKFLFCSQQ